MDKKFLKRGFLLVIIVCCFTSISIYAATNIGGTVGIVEKNVCIPTGTTVVKDDGTTVSATGAYHIKYTSENSTMVDYNKLTSCKQQVNLLQYKKLTSLQRRC